MHHPAQLLCPGALVGIDEDAAKCDRSGLVQIDLYPGGDFDTHHILEAGWEGIITLEITNVTPLPAKVYANEGIAQILFFEGDELCDTSYADRKGKYQNQQGVVLPRI